MIAQHEPEARVARRHEGEWHQEVLAKLLVRSPRRAIVVALEREGIDEDWTPGRELHVVSARVAKYEAPLERTQLDVECEQGGVLQLTEAPLVRVRDERDDVRRDDGVRFRRQGERLIHSPVRHEQMLAYKCVIEPGAGARLELVGEHAVDLAAQRAARRENETGRVPERSAEPRQSLPRAAGEAGEECAHRASYAPDEGGGRKHGCGGNLKNEAASAGVDVHECYQWLNCSSARYAFALVVALFRSGFRSIVGTRHARVKRGSSNLTVNGTAGRYGPVPRGILQRDACHRGTASMSRDQVDSRLPR
jgi:hypothetical protein